MFSGRKRNNIYENDRQTIRAYPNQTNQRRGESYVFKSLPKPAYDSAQSRWREGGPRGIGGESVRPL